MRSLLFMLLPSLSLLGVAPGGAVPAAAVPPPVAATTLPPVPADVLDQKNCTVRVGQIDAPSLHFHDTAFVGKDVFLTVEVNRFQGRYPVIEDGRFGVAYVQLDAGPGLYTTADFVGNRRILAFHNLSTGRHRVAMALLSGIRYVPAAAQCFDVP
jgi:hypothetical protein